MRLPVIPPCRLAARAFQFCLAAMAIGMSPQLNGAAWAQSGSSGAKPSAPIRQPQGTRPPAGPSAALRQEAERKAGPLTLTSADGARACPLVLTSVPTGAGFGLAFGGGGCPQIAFTAQVSAWLPDAIGSIHLISAQGRTVAEFTEGAAGNYEALREGDGVYFLASPAALQENILRPEEMLGEWDLSRSAGTPVCRWIFGEAPAAGGGFVIMVVPGCESALAAFAPASWRLEGGNVLVTSASGAAPLRFARQEDGGWAKVPERGRPLLLSRP